MVHYDAQFSVSLFAFAESPNLSLLFEFNQRAFKDSAVSSDNEVQRVVSLLTLFLNNFAKLISFDRNQAGQHKDVVRRLVIFVCKQSATLQRHDFVVEQFQISSLRISGTSATLCVLKNVALTAAKSFYVAVFLVY